MLAGRDELVLELPEPAWVDIEAAGSQADRADQALLRGDPRGAWALAQVPLNIASRGLLPGRQAAWLGSAARELADLRLQALEVIGRTGLMLGGTQLGSVQRAARALIAAEPYRETGYVLLMQAFEAQGNVAEGLRVFDELRLLLRDELGTTPSPDAIAAHQGCSHPASRRRSTRSRRRRSAGARAGPTLQLPRPAELPRAGPRGADGRPRRRAGRARTVAARRRARTRRPSARRADAAAEGDPGVGKTRLIAELAPRAHAAGTLVLAGRAPEETLVAFQPFLEALGQYVDAAPLDELRAHARHHGAELARLVPELRRRMPELPPTDVGDPETERYRLFEAVVGLLGRLSAAAPVLIVLDDLHWADRPTLMLLRHLARAPQAARLSVVGAYRADRALERGLRAALANLRHERLMRQIELPGCPSATPRAWSACAPGGAPSPEFSRALYEETEGNPFFIEEIVRHLRTPASRSRSAGA